MQTLSLQKVANHAEILSDVTNRIFNRVMFGFHACMVKRTNRLSVLNARVRIGTGQDKDKVKPRNDR